MAVVSIAVRQCILMALQCSQSNLEAGRSKRSTAQSTPVWLPETILWMVLAFVIGPLYELQNENPDSVW
jgi:hypothetical protein